MWLDAGLELGNHTYSHRDLNTVPLDQFQADVLRGETVTRGLLKGRAQRLRYFRHPFLHMGSDLKVRRAFEVFLSSHGYTVAPVTVDNDDFVYAAAYAKALRRGHTADAVRIADLTARALPRLASTSDRDPRAPQNLVPVGDRKSTRLNSSHLTQSRMPSSA